MNRGQTFNIFGADLTVREMAVLANIGFTTMHHRLKTGMSPEAAVITPCEDRGADDLTGAEFNHYKVLRFAGYTAAKKRKWLCRCDCGAEKEVVGADLKSGRTTSCGHVMAQKASARQLARAGDLTGHEFADGKVRVLRVADKPVMKWTPKGDKPVRGWVCVCLNPRDGSPCGNEFVTHASVLKQGQVTSCGCARGARASAMGRARTLRFEIDGTSMTLLEMAALSGIAGPTLAYRIRELGMSPKEAMCTTALRTKPRDVAVRP